MTRVVYAYPHGKAPCIILAKFLLTFYRSKTNFTIKSHYEKPIKGSQGTSPATIALTIQ